METINKCCGDFEDYTTAEIGDFVILELVENYQTSFGGLIELGDTMNYTLVFQNSTNLHFYETIISEGSFVSYNWYNLTKESISIHISLLLRMFPLYLILSGIHHGISMLLLQVFIFGKPLLITQLKVL